MPSNFLNEEQKSTSTKRTPESQTSEEYSIPEEISVVYDQSSKCKHQHSLSDYQTTECSYEKMPYEYIIHQQQQGIQQQKLLKEQQNKEKIALQSFLAQTNKQVNIKYSSDSLDKQQKEQKQKFKKNVPF